MNEVSKDWKGDGEMKDKPKEVTRCVNCGKEIPKDSNIHLCSECKFSKDFDRL